MSTNSTALLNFNEAGDPTSLNLYALVNHPSLAGIQVPLILENYISDRAWSKVSIDGPIAFGKLNGRSLLDVGSGPGTISIALNKIFNITRSFGAEYVPAAVERHKATNEDLGIQNSDIRHSDVLSAYTAQDLKDPNLISVICIPQVPAAKNAIPTTRELSDVYVAEGSEWDYAGLGLLDKVFNQANEKAPHAPALTTIHGRLDDQTLNHFITQHDREIGRTLARVVTPHDIDTPLDGFAEREGDDQEFLLYSDPELKKRVTAAQGEELRLEAREQGKSTMDNLFHTVSSREISPAQSKQRTYLPS